MSARQMTFADAGLLKRRSAVPPDNPSPSPLPHSKQAARAALQNDHNAYTSTPPQPETAKEVSEHPNTTMRNFASFCRRVEKEAHRLSLDDMHPMRLCDVTAPDGTRLRTPMLDGMSVRHYRSLPVDADQPSTSFSTAPPPAPTNAPRCCLAERASSGWRACPRAAARLLTPRLQTLAKQKTMRLAVDNQRSSHLSICIYHRRLMAYGKAGDDRVYHPQWEMPETRLEKAEIDDDMDEDSSSSSSSSSSSDEGSGDEDDPMGEDYCVFVSRKRLREAEKAEGEPATRRSARRAARHREEEDDDDEDKANLSALSAVVLRRYRKYFEIPTKASATKASMLEGVEQHFAGLPADTNETIAYFVHAIRSGSNKLD